MLLPRIHSREARSELTNQWEVIRDGLTALGEVYAIEYGTRLADKIWGPFDNRIVRKQTDEFVTEHLRDLLNSLRQDRLDNANRSDTDA